MTSDPDIQRAALHMMQLHGVLAEAAARKRVHELTQDRQLNAAALWLKIAEAIAELLRP
jgi:hypothetical protein